MSLFGALREHYAVRPPWWRIFARRAWSRRRNEILYATDAEVRAMLGGLYPPSAVEELAARRNPFLATRGR